MVVPSTATTAMAWAESNEIGRHEDALQRLAPGHVHGDDDDDIGKQRQGQPFEDGGVSRIAHEDLQQHADDGEDHRVDECGAADEQLDRRPHGAEISPEIGDIGDEQQRHHDAQQPARVVAPEVLRDAAPGDAADAGGDGLRHRHQRIAEQQDPGELIAELRADLAVGRDAARIVVGGAGDEAGSERAQNPSGEAAAARRARCCSMSTRSCMAQIPISPPAQQDHDDLGSSSIQNHERDRFQ